MKSVLISIQPKWCELIASGKKTVEVRKTKPKLDVPFKCYIYMTMGKCPKFVYNEKLKKQSIYEREPNTANGKVIGEFVCDRIYKIYQCNSGWVQEYGCISREEFFDYLGLPYNSHFDEKGAFAWHISDLVIYDKPRELSEFKRVCDGNCQTCQYAIWQTNGWAYDPYIVDCKPITRPPQSWCYVESEGAE